jgi:hypothetical protein
VPPEHPIDFILLPEPPTNSETWGDDGPLTLIFTENAEVEAYGLEETDRPAAYLSSDAAFSDLGPVIVALAEFCSGRRTG